VTTKENENGFDNQTKTKTAFWCFTNKSWY